MLKFIKSFGLGLLYMLLSPFLLLILLAFALYGIFNFFLVLGQGLVRFFKGQPFFPPFEEDEKAERMLNRGLEEKAETAPVAGTSAGTTNVYVQQNIYQGTAPTNSQVPPLPSARIPDIPGVDPKVIEDVSSKIPPLPQEAQYQQIEDAKPLLSENNEEEAIDLREDASDGQ